MLVLEATPNKQGERDGDYHWCADGELAYKPSIDCDSPGCGCNRGWAGVDSHRATTTVQVVDRPDLTVNDLASELAVSLFDGGWLTTPDPGDELVSLCVDDIVEIANHFGEGAVLEREGHWTKVRDGSAGSVNPFDRVALEDLTEDLLHSGPMDTMSHAMSIMANVHPHVDALLLTLTEADWPEAQALGCALEWLSHGKLTNQWKDVPHWLTNLDQAEITAARRCRGDDGDGYLVAMEVDGYELGIASFFVKHEGHIDSFFAIPDSIATYTQLMKTLQRRHYKPFRKIAPATARAALEQAKDVPVAPEDIHPGFSWPRSRPLLDLIFEQMTWCV